jgi:transposase-like protein
MRRLGEEVSMAQASMKDAVLAWMRETGATSAEAAAKFDVQSSTVRQWVSRERKAAGIVTVKRDGPVADPVTAPTRTQASTLPPAQPKKGKSGILDPKDLTEVAKSRLRGATRKYLDWLDSDEALKDPRNAAQLARALETLVKLCPELLTLEERTGDDVGGAGDLGGEDATARLREALACPEEPGDKS